MSYGFTPRLSQNMSFRRRSSEPISWCKPNTEETKLKTTKANNKEQDSQTDAKLEKYSQKAKPKQTHN